MFTVFFTDQLAQYENCIRSRSGMVMASRWNSTGHSNDFITTEARVMCL